jgi:hypothetical protein
MGNGYWLLGLRSVQVFVNGYWLLVNGYFDSDQYKYWLMDICYLLMVIG